MRTVLSRNHKAPRPYYAICLQGSALANAAEYFAYEDRLERDELWDNVGWRHKSKCRVAYRINVYPKIKSK